MRCENSWVPINTPYLLACLQNNLRVLWSMVSGPNGTHGPHVQPRVTEACRHVSATVQIRRHKMAAQSASACLLRAGRAVSGRAQVCTLAGVCIQAHSHPPINTHVLPLLPTPLHTRHTTPHSTPHAPHHSPLHSTRVTPLPTPLHYFDAYQI